MYRLLYIFVAQS